jgi:hypothetical protein
MGKRGFDDVFLDESTGCVEASVEVEGGDNGFESVGEESGLSAAAALFLTAAEAEERAEFDAVGYFAEMAAADQRGSETGEFAFARGWETMKEGFGNDKAENGVADKLKLLVIGGRSGE